MIVNVNGEINMFKGGHRQLGCRTNKYQRTCIEGGEKSFLVGGGGWFSEESTYGTPLHEVFFLPNPLVVSPFPLLFGNFILSPL